VQAAQLLISSNANVHEKNKFGQTPLHLAVFQLANKPAARLLIDNSANIHEKDNDGRTPAMSNALGRNCCKIL
jgi:ankyrin repeat protein